jgi:hypothetical protein
MPGPLIATTLSISTRRTMGPREARKLGGGKANRDAI